MEITLESIGLTKEELQKKLIDKLAESALLRLGFDPEEGGEIQLDSPLAHRLSMQVEATINKAVQDLAKKHVLPDVAKYVEQVALQATNAWGEKRGPVLTFKEYLTQMAKAFIEEPVDYQGKTKRQDSYGWTARQSRIVHMIHDHLHYSINFILQDTIKKANETLIKGIEETVTIQLKEIAKKLKVSVKTDT